MPATPDPDLGLRLAKALVAIYGGAVLELLRLVAARLARGIDRPGWAEAKLLQSAQLRDQAQAIVDRLTGDVPDVVAEAIGEAFDTGGRDVAGEVDPDVIGLPGRRERGVEALVAETVSKLRSTHFLIVRQVDDAYRTVISETVSLVNAGVHTRLQAAQASLDQFAQRGITGFIDRAGRRWEIETYAEMALRTASGRAQVEGALARFVAAGRDLVIVSNAPQECFLCRPFEGKVLSISGTDPEAPSVAHAVSEGLFHANCRHSMSAFIPGLTRAPTDTADPEGDEARQEQRRLERGIRQWKRRAAAAVDPRARARAERHARQWQARLRDHIAETGLIRRRERERLGAR